jgi:hypothetical protein
MANTMTLIASSIVGVTPAATIDFTSIPSTYTDLVLKYSLRDNTVAFAQNVQIKINGSTASVYSSKLLQGNGTAANSYNQSGTLSSLQYMTASTATASTFSNGEFYFPNYASSANKSYSYDGVTENNATSAITALTAGLWGNSAAITSLSIFTEGGGGTLQQYSTAYLYGIKNS